MTLDPARYMTVKPADAEQTMPYPGRPVPLSNDGEPVDGFDAYWIMAIADGSVVKVDDTPGPKGKALVPPKPDV